mmetsp:Transcript_7904/g.26413  ORF Transcript_7904/g.26413 Transcript_7904/m.26413 type:complete len:220 (-) Transcript_7904:409-1068(-)
MIPRPMAELLRHHPRNLPAARHHLPVREGEGAEPATQPCESLLDALEPRGMFGGVEQILVLPELLIGEPLDELEDQPLPQYAHHLGRVLEHARHVLRHRDVDVQLELLEHLSLQLRPQGSYGGEELANLGDVLECVEVGGQLRHGLQEVRCLLVSSSCRHFRQLLDRVLQHVQPPQRDDGRRQVLLGKVQRLDVSADLVDHALGRLPPLLDTLEVRHQL